MVTHLHASIWVITLKMNELNIPLKRLWEVGGELDESGQNVQASRYKINKPLECNVQHD